MNDRTSVTKPQVEMPLGAREIHADYMGFKALAQLHAEIATLEDCHLIVGCENLRWFDAQLGAPLLTIAGHARNRNVDISLKNMPSQVKTILKKNGTLKGELEDTHKTTIKITKFELDEEVKFATYAKDNFSKKQVPKMSDGLSRKFFEGIDELFANCALHSKSETPVFAGGQFFPASDKLSFTISDGGRGIHGSLQSAGMDFGSDRDAIDWAMGKTNSARSGDIPGGLGLWILQEFIAMNEGRLAICSHSGYWEKQGAEVTTRRLPAPFPGTIASLEINTADRRQYDLEQLVSPHDIW